MAVICFTVVTTSIGYTSGYAISIGIGHGLKIAI